MDMYTPLSHLCTIQSHENWPSLNAYATVPCPPSAWEDNMRSYIVLPGAEWTI